MWKVLTCCIAVVHTIKRSQPAASVESIVSMYCYFVLHTVPSVIDNSVIEVDEDSDVISWVPPTDPGGEILFYQILITRDRENVRTVETTENSLDVSSLDLDPGRYEVQVRHSIVLAITWLNNSSCSNN